MCKRESERCTHTSPICQTLSSRSVIVLVLKVLGGDNTPSPSLLLSLCVFLSNTNDDNDMDDFVGSYMYDEDTGDRGTVVAFEDETSSDGSTSSKEYVLDLKKR